MEHRNTAAADSLEEHGIRPSFQRIRILEYLRANRTHPTAEEIFCALSPEIPTLSRTTVYNTLGLLIRSGLAVSVLIEEKEARFDADTSLHGHFRCGVCGRVFDFPVELSEIRSRELEGFAVSTRDVYYRGVCPDCLDQ